MQDSIDLALELNTEWSNFFIAMPYPGTEMYCKAEPKDLPEKWEQYGFFAPNAKPLPTKYVSSQDVVKFRDKAFETFFSSAQYQDMIEKKFGMKKYIQDMLKRRIGRIYDKN
jgi:anaerobic magnesium-protoporphyrin IX monomethyl ester cyclase